MAKRVVWTNTAKNARREILEYWIEHNGSNTYSKKLAQLFKLKAALLQTGRYLGKPTDFKDVRVSLVNRFSIFYKVMENEIIIVGVWDNRAKRRLRTRRSVAKQLRRSSAGTQMIFVKILSFN